MSSGFSISELEVGNCIQIEIGGEVDIYSCQLLKEKLYHCVEKYGKDIVLDCSALNYIDSTGLGVFVAVLKRVKQIHKQITIVNLKDSIKKLFVITSLDALFNIQ